MKFKTWFNEDAQGATGNIDNGGVDPQDANLYDPAGNERRPVPTSKKANKVFGVKVRPADKEKKVLPSFVRTKV